MFCYVVVKLRKKTFEEILVKINGIAQNNYVAQNNTQQHNPSFQHLKIYGEGHWDKDILKQIKNNEEIKKFERFLEKRFSVLELNFQSHDYDLKAGKSKLFSIGCIYDRKKKISGEEIVLFAKKEKRELVEAIKNFKALDIIREIFPEHANVELEEQPKVGFFKRLFSSFKKDKKSE